MSTTPVIFLDVDGAINCFPSPDFSQLINSQDWRDKEVDGYKLWWRQTVVDFFNKLSQSREVEIIWLTTWKGKASELVGPALGLETFSAVVKTTGSRYPDTPTWWKWLRVREFMEANPDRPIVWIDDDLRAPILPAAQKRGGANLLLVVPRSNPGLSDQDLKNISVFLKNKGVKAHGG